MTFWGKTYVSPYDSQRSSLHEFRCEVGLVIHKQHNIIWHFKVCNIFWANCTVKLLQNVAKSSCNVSYKRHDGPAWCKSNLINLLTDSLSCSYARHGRYSSMTERSPHTLPRNHCFYQLEKWNRTFKRVLSKVICKIILPRIHCFDQMENWNRTFKKRVVKKETQDFRRLLFIHQIKIRMLKGLSIGRFQSWQKVRKFSLKCKGK